MRAFVRGSLLWLAAAVAVILVIDVLSDSERGTVHAATIATVLGGVAVLQLVLAFGRRWPGVWDRRSPLVAGARTAGVAASERGQVDTIREWEALMVTGTTGGPRGRERLARRLEPLAVPAARPLLDELRSVPSDHVLAVVERFATEVERTHDD